MKKEWLIKTFALGVVVLFFRAIVTPSIGGDFVNTNEIFSKGLVSSSEIDWWPMFRHDPQHSGNTSSPGPITNNILWRFDTGHNIYSNPAIVNDRVYVGSFSKLYCLDALTGESIWEFTVGDSIRSSPCVYDNKVIFNSRDGVLYCVDAENGSKIWTFFANIDEQNSPTAVDGKVFFGSESYQNNKGVIYCLNVEDGSVLWYLNTNESRFSSPAYIDGKIYIGTVRNSQLFWIFPLFIYCLDADSGDIQWKKTIGFNKLPYAPEVSLCEDKLYFGVSSIFGGKVGCLNAQTGNFIWRYYTDFVWNCWWVVTISAPSIAYDRIYFEIADFIKDTNEVRCLDANSGKHIWTFKDGAGTPIISDGKVYFGSSEVKVTFPKGTIYCLDAENGSIIWKYKTYNDVISAPSIVNGRMYIGTLIDKVLCFG